MLDSLKPIFEKIDAEIFDEDTKNSLAQIFEDTIKTKVDEKLQLAVESALQEKDEEITKKTQHLIETFRKNIDQDHTAKIKFVVENINRDHMNKLLTLKEKYDTLLKDTAHQHRDQLVESVDRFLEKYLDKNIPKEKILGAAKNKHVEQLLEQVREVAGIDQKYIKENVKKGILDGKRQMEKLLRENAELKQRKDAEQAKRFLVEKTANLPAETAKFVRSRLANKSFQYIKENFDFVIDLFDKSEKKQKRQLTRESSQDRIIVESTPLLNRQETQAPHNSMMNVYLEELQKISTVKS